ncbi:MAG: DUF1778 domain-containing protein [Novosphingobium sp.]
MPSLIVLHDCAAKDVLMETSPIRMSAEGFDAFMAAVSGPGAPVPEMMDLFRRAASWEADHPPARE